MPIWFTGLSAVVMFDRKLDLCLDPSVHMEFASPEVDKQMQCCNCNPQILTYTLRTVTMHRFTTWRYLD